MTKTVTPFTAQLVTFDTTLPIADVLARLDETVNKSGSALIMSRLRTASSHDEVQEVVNSITGASGFLYFGSLNHDPWLDVYHGVNNTPKTVLYTIGNPLIAETMLKHELRAALNIPPRLLVLEKADGNGTYVIYHLPSSVIALAGTSFELRAAAEALDEKLDRMVMSITAV